MAKKKLQLKKLRAIKGGGQAGEAADTYQCSTVMSRTGCVTNKGITV